MAITSDDGAQFLDGGNILDLLFGARGVLP